VELTFVGLDGSERRAGLLHCQGVPFESVKPVRESRSVRGQSHFPGSWWFSRTGDHVGFESWLERDVLMMLDADPEVAAVSS